MKRTRLAVGLALGIGVALGLVGSRLWSAEPAMDPLKMGKVIATTELSSPKGLEAMLVERELPPGAASGKHTQMDTEIVYIEQGTVIVEVAGKPPMTVHAGEAFSTSAGQVHNVKNASTTEGGKALAFYIAKKGTGLAELSKPVP
jgi:quercetin dioxygenase-like cupin family protein